MYWRSVVFLLMYLILHGVPQSWLGPLAARLTVSP